MKKIFFAEKAKNAIKVRGDQSSTINDYHSGCKISHVFKNRNTDSLYFLTSKNISPCFFFSENKMNFRGNQLGWGCLVHSIFVCEKLLTSMFPFLHALFGK